MCDDDENLSLLEKNIFVYSSTNKRLFYFKIVVLFFVLFYVRMFSKPTTVLPLPHVSPSEVLFTMGEEYELHFTLNDTVSDLSLSLDDGSTFDDIKLEGSLLSIAYYYSVALPGLVPGKTYRWSLGCCSSGSFKTVPLSSPRICLVGDTAPPVGYKILSAMNSTICDMVVHLGDLSYISNDGGCYRDSGAPKCKYNCRGTVCAHNERNTKDRMRKWKAFYDHVDLSSIPFVTQMGNHDNDLFWYYKFRPLTSFEQGPSFFWGARIADGLSILSISTEDNVNNAYEQWGGNDDEDFDVDRWEEHFGVHSRQYQYSQKFIDSVPSHDILIVFTHRPLFHTSGHHPDCGGGGSWYRCKFREVWGPLMDKVDYVFTGHSHHLMISKPSMLRENGLSVGNTIFSVVGTGGFKLTNRLRSNPQVEKLSDKEYGFIIYHDNMLKFQVIH